MKNSLKLIGSLTGICILSGALLAFVYGATAERIEAVAQMRIAAAAAQVLPAHENVGEAIEVSHNDTDLLFRPAYLGDGKLVGYAIQFATSAGYGGTIRMMLGIDTQGKTTGLVILPGHSETPGLGAKITEDAFLQAFTGKLLTETNWRVTSDGGVIDSITAATVSSRAVAEAVLMAATAFETNRDMLKEKR